ncbi:MAG TPA: hypothetical protein VII24_04790 [Pseudolabrys sp.]
MATKKVSMRTPIKQKQTWGWSDILAAVGETPAAFRHKLRREQVKLETADADETRTRATIWDIARLRVSRHLCDIGLEAEQAFGLAKFLVDLAYKDLIDGANFTESGGKRQEFLFAVFFRVGPMPGGPRIIRVKPNDPQADQITALVEIGLQASNPQNIIVPIHKLVLDAWYSLPNLPGDVEGWMKATSLKMSALEELSGKGASR